MPSQHSTGTDPEAEPPGYTGQYRLEAELGSGGMGVVHLARSHSGLRLAVKVVHAAFAQDPEFRGRFRQEVAAARRVSGAFTAPVVDADPEAGRPWMATLFIPGPTLAEHVKRNGALPAARLRQLMAGLAEALRDIHRAGVVHRDLKPSNVLLAEDGPKVIDFGISRPSDSELRTETGKLIGTPPFMAPEQFRRPREVGPAADVFALGSVIVHAATGSGPFDSDSPYLVAYQVVHDEPDLTGLPVELSALVARCLAKEPEDRPTPDEVMTELRAARASYDTQAFIPEQRGAGGVGGTGRGSEDGPHGPGSPAASADTHARAISAAAPSAAGSPSAGSSAAGPPAAASSKTAAESSTTAGRRLRLPRPARGRRPWWAPAVALAALTAAVGAVVLAPDDESPVAQEPQPSASAFRPWAVTVGARGAGATGLPWCSYTPGTLHCARPGVLAAAVDPEDGKVLWSRGGSRPDDGTTLAPVLSGGLLHVVGADGDGRRLTALEPTTGRTRWSRAIPAADGPVTHVGGLVLLTGADATVTALDSATGEERWRRAFPGLGQPSPSFQSYGDGLAYAVGADGADTRVTVVDPETGDVRRQRRLEGALGLVGARDGTLWFTSTDLYSATDAVVRYDVADDSVRRVGLHFALPGAQAVVGGDTVYLLADGGTLAAVDTRAGAREAELWRLETSVSRASAPVVAGQRLYFTAADGRLLAVGTARGRLLGQTEPRLAEDPSALIAQMPAPVTARGKVYAGAPDGSLFAVDAGDPASW
ncbi:serine/threonine-protein kinase [Streptomyces sp. CRN 30]|uniref:serine/threonine-protein kinase n=1 Tax=Streptomyces sp. CRN 30 TaxID=3075613 RepID=UPI002A7FF12F|nr:serine/threonine-protein kinase [Streptomyces sp. CRN 30]